MASELVQIEFHGDTIEATIDQKGRVLVAFGQLCKTLNQDYEKQLEKLRSRSWASVCQAQMMTKTKVIRTQTAIDLKTLGGWLFSINENRVPAHSREKLIRYQLECVTVLERHFMSRSAPPIKYQPWSERFRESFAPHNQSVLSGFPAGAFTSITEGVMTMLMMEDELLRHMMDVRPGDRPCISIGLTWSNYRRVTLNRNGCLGEAPIWLPDREMFVPVKVYPGCELNDFKTWLHFTYLPGKLQAYLDNKPEFRVYGTLPRASVADNTCRLITGRGSHLNASQRQILTANNNFIPARPTLNGTTGIGSGD